MSILYKKLLKVFVKIIILMILNAKMSGLTSKAYVDNTMIIMLK